ncbi:MAG: DUF362 domain-containing protein [Pedobacter sp.]
MSRRLFLWLTAAAVFLLTFRSSVAGDLLFFRPSRREKPRVPEDRFVSEGKALVGVAGGSEPFEDRIRRAVDLIGGFERLNIRGRTVLVKPNVVSGNPSPTTTSPEVVAAVVRLLYAQGARQVVVGDMSALLSRATLENMQRCGIRQAAEQAGAKVVAFEDFDWVEVPLPDGRYLKKALVSEWLYRVDIIVNLPVVKTHRSASYTICLKNFIGCTHFRQRPYLVDRRHWEELVAEFNLACRPDLNIVDATTTMIEGGPWEGTSAPTGLIIASGDRVAADIVGLGLIRSFGRWQPVTEKGVWEQRQVQHALILGLGRGRDGITLRSTDGDAKFQELMSAVRRETGL